MRRSCTLTILICVAVAALLAIGQQAVPITHAQAPAPRLVVFELFDSTCSTCVEAGAAVDVLARRYAEQHKPVVFVEYYSSDAPANRMDRWYDALPNWGDCYLPLELIDSGWRAGCGPKDFIAQYTALVDQALAVPAGVDLEGYYTRSGDSLDVWLSITNRGQQRLGIDNRATANVIVFENARVMNTDRFGRASASVGLKPSLLAGAHHTYNMHLDDVPVAHWDRAVVLVMVDYRPNDDSSHYESLQAAIAVEGTPPAPTPSASPTPSPTATLGATATRSPSSSATANGSATQSPGPTRTPGGAISATPTPDSAQTSVPVTVTTGLPGRPVFFPLAAKELRHPTEPTEEMNRLFDDR